MHELGGQRPVLVVGCGEVGSIILEHLSGRGVATVAVDPDRASSKGRSPVLPDIPPADYGLVLSCVPSSASSSVARRCAGLASAPLHIDLSSSPRDMMLGAAEAFTDHRFVDGAIMGSVASRGAATPLLLSGARAAEAAERLRALGFVVKALPDSRPGDAGALKLLRSVVTKGLEAVAVEGLLAARRMGLLDRLLENLEDVARPTFPEFLDVLVRTHVLHATRRASEVGAAAGQLESAGADASLTRAVEELFERTAAARLKTPPGPMSNREDALAWLEEARA